VGLGFSEDQSTVRMDRLTVIVDVVSDITRHISSDGPDVG